MPDKKRLEWETDVLFIEEQPVDEQEDQAIYRLAGGNHRDQHDETNWTDTTALAVGYITLTSLRQDLTDTAGNERLGEKLLALCKMGV